MRIVIVTAGIEIGGTQRVVEILASSFAKRGHQIILSSFCSEGKPRSFGGDSSVALHRLGKADWDGRRIPSLKH